MSTVVHVVCEDPQLDQYVAVPVVEALFRRGLGRKQTQVRAVTNPRIRGIENMLKNVVSVAGRYAPLGDFVVFVADLDGQDGAEGSGDRFAAFADRIATLPAHVQEKVVVVLGVQEIEVWCLWGVQSQLADPWATVRAERDPKELYFEPLLDDRDRLSLGRGRRRFIEMSLGRGWPSLRSACSELAEAEDDIRRRLSA